MSADYALHGTVAVITLNNPPVNGLGLVTRTAAVDGIRRAQDDPAVAAIVITGAGKAFSGGADIREFNSPKALTEPTLHTLIRTAEESAKPVVAAIHSVCMGGGLELSLGCHYRVALPGAQVALPEVKLGLLPGAGGTQRLPRAIGLEPALEMIVSGNPVLSERLPALFDEVFAPGTDLVAAAVAFAEKIAPVRPLPKVRDRQAAHADAAAFLQAARARVAAAAGPFPAPLECVETIAAAVSMPFEQGLAFERERFMHLIRTPESRALRHAFFAEREAAKVPGVPADTPRRPIEQAAVIGAGTMGSGIAMAFANAGIPVRLLESSPEALDKGLTAIRAHYEGAAGKGKLTPELLARRMALISGTVRSAEIAGADIVIEAVFEDMAIKEAVFRQLDDVMKPGAILATNTSTLDVDRIAAVTRRPQDVIGTHFFSPAHVMKLLEIVRGRATGNDVLATVLALAKRLKKTGVVSGVCDGFIGNRMIEQYIRQAGFLLEEGCTPAQVDGALERFGFAMGPFRMSDLAGNDIGWAIRKRRAAERPGMTYSKVADLLCEVGRFGQKTGAGWYDYRPGDRTPHPSAQVDTLIVDYARQAGIEPRRIGDEEIVERLVYALVNEGALILEEGIALRASDIDMVYLTGYGFPLFRGGPMFHADTVGLPNVLAAIERFAAGAHGEAWRPAPLLVRLAAERKGFNDR
ncbi:3-hydroxyacyl-CoA dehydrogenase NAD-binding domain-containing protein [Pseudoduganella sp. SL102]|uniref:3-hydroxyacyl-CoA dehydrogenase NAD-binding domain-containing protein n=1 Tax=Pseudoduganella sp. SL102 TaxID=2995154 RepID=UPI00248CAD18|nr:3-hydroxyacyl-CoA dehydrogenase NAD-binding domain-containing protein [Pseudoduganella sp. SL102]WBS00264.1 3-hydroxyacyl-CoA dehydrogenase NAD-binding domain-containing protein [Pseudoduganella sp. SL102]